MGEVDGDDGGGGVEPQAASLRGYPANDPSFLCLSYATSHDDISHSSNHSNNHASTHLPNVSRKEYYRS